MSGTWIYRLALRLYPRAYREKFGDEMLRTLEAVPHERGGGTSAARELGGLLRGAIAAWFLGSADASTATGLREIGLAEGGVRIPIPEDLLAAERRVALLVDRMTRAIATHKFVEARACSFEERQARAELQRIRAQYGLPGDTSFA